MPDLKFQVESCEALLYAAVPMLGLKLKIFNHPIEQAIHTLTLRCQVQIEPAKRRYVATEQAKLRDLFGEPERWGRTVRPMLWMNTSVSVPGFTGVTTVDVELPCSFDFNVAATKYFHALESGEIAICVMFSGTVFYADADGSMQITQIPWDREVNFRLPIEMWKGVIDAYYPETAWLCLRRDIFERLYDYKVRHGIPTWEQLIEKILPQGASQEAEPAKAPEAEAEVKA
ncbi:MAG: DUF6084 family protein [Acidobacteriaceae bacterium]